MNIQRIIALPADVVISDIEASAGIFNKEYVCTEGCVACFIIFGICADKAVDNLKMRSFVIYNKALSRITVKRNAVNRTFLLEAILMKILS